MLGSLGRDLGEMKAMKMIKFGNTLLLKNPSLMAKDETKLFDAIMDVGANPAKIQGVEFSYRKYIKEEQMERFNERLEFRLLLLRKHNEKKKENK